MSLIPAIDLSPVTTTTAINLLPVTTTLVIRVCGVSMNRSFHGGSNETIGGHVRLRRPELLPFWFEVVWRPQGPLIRAFGVSMDASLHGGSNDTIGGRVRPQRPVILLSYCQHCLFAVVVDTGEQFIGGVIDTGDKIAPRCRWYQSEITKKPKIYRRCKRQCQKTVHRCQRYRR